MIKALIFDYGGVLGCDSNEQIFNTVALRFGIDKNLIKNKYRVYASELQKGLLSGNDFWKKFSLDLNLDVDDKKNLKKVWLRAYEKNVALNQDVIDLAQSLSHNYSLCVMSNCISFFNKNSLQKKVNGIFPLILNSYDVHMRKPEKEFYLYALSQLGVEASECIFIDNQEKNLSYPKRIGMKTICFTSIEQLKKELRSWISWSSSDTVQPTI